LVDGVLPAACHAVAWGAIDVASGIYFYGLTAGSLVQTNQMMLLK
jgi:hypothetical protein